MSPHQSVLSHITSLCNAGLHQGMMRKAGSACPQPLLMTCCALAQVKSAGFLTCACSVER